MVGGGIIGAACADEPTRRGGSVTLIERDELADERLAGVSPASLSPRGCFGQTETIAIPKGVAPVGSAVGDDDSSESEPPFTANPLTEAMAASTT